MVYGLIHTAVILVVLILSSRNSTCPRPNVGTALVFMALGSFSFVGIGILAAILPLLYVERGAQMTFVVQSSLLLVSGVYYPVDILPGWMQVLSHLSPATYVLDGVRAGLTTAWASAELGATSGRWSCWASCSSRSALWAFGRAERYAKRTGKLKRVG